MNRYIPTSGNTFARYDGKRVFRTTRYPIIPVDQNDVYIIATETDYLDTLADRFYNDATLWWVIAQANSIKNTLKVPAGKQLRIPSDITEIVARFNRENSE